jgi:hypothetical protein
MTPIFFHRQVDYVSFESESPDSEDNNKIREIRAKKNISSYRVNPVTPREADKVTERAYFNGVNHL